MNCYNTHFEITDLDPPEDLHGVGGQYLGWTVRGGKGEMQGSHLLPMEIPSICGNAQMEISTVLMQTNGKHVPDSAPL